MAVLVNPTSPTTESQLNRLEAAARELKVQIQVFRAASELEFGAVFDKMRSMNAAGLVVASDTYFTLHSGPLAALALKYRLPAITQSRDFPIAGGLMSYGGNFSESHRIAGVYTARIIKGARPVRPSRSTGKKLRILLEPQNGEDPRDHITRESAGGCRQGYRVTERLR